MTQATRSPPASRGPGLLQSAPLVAPLIAVYAISQFLRTSTGVIAPDLARELDLTPQGLGLLSSAFFFSFALAQIPIGVVIDRFGPKAAVMGSLGLAVAGAAAFAVSHSAAGLTLARVLMGLGCSTFYVAPLALYAQRFAADRFASLVGLHIGIGSCGALVATAPLAYSAAAIGWRASFWVAAAAALALGALVAWWVPARHDAAPVHPPRLRDVIAGLSDVFRTRGVWPLFAMNMATYSTFATLMGLWAGTYLADVHGLEVQARGQVLLLVAGAQIAGLLGWGALAHRFKTRKRPVAASAVLAVSALCTLAAFPGLPLPAATALLSLVAIGVACVPILVAHGKESFAPHLLGRGITVLNLANMGGVFVMQMATAQVIAWLDGPAHGVVHALDAYRGMFLFIAATLAAALALYAAAPEGQHRSPH